MTHTEAIEVLLNSHAHTMEDIETARDVLDESKKKSVALDRITAIMLSDPKESYGELRHDILQVLEALELDTEGKQDE